MDALAVLALVSEGARGKLSGADLFAAVFDRANATARRGLALNHEIGMFRH
jgi:hypothetical protein